VPAQVNGQKNIMTMSDEEIANLPSEEFEKIAPSMAGSKKFYAET